MGTPDFAVPTLTTLLHGPDQVVLVVTQPDRPSGRGRTPTPPPVKRVADDHGVKVLQPEHLKGAEVFEEVARAQPDVCVVAAFGKILGKRYLALPPLGCFNVHASLLPRWRGAAPINWAILGGDRRTGVTIMKMDPGLDTGPIVRSWATEIGPTETAGELHDRLALAGARLMAEVLDDLRARRAIPLTEQNGELATYAPMLAKEDGPVDFTASPARFVAHVHAMTPWPAATCLTPRGPLRLCRAEVAGDVATAPAGTVVAADQKNGLLLAVSGGVVRILECQRPGKQVHPACEYLRGLQIDPVGERWSGRTTDLPASGEG
ncbi:MAG: methionyl-tRNA formyltransferase [Bradymonadales bacterium]|nr:methionyl-tRNA formyltransferase [Bradymonadales bacterium]